MVTTSIKYDRTFEETMNRQFKMMLVMQAAGSRYVSFGGYMETSLASPIHVKLHSGFVMFANNHAVASPLNLNGIRLFWDETGFWFINRQKYEPGQFVSIPISTMTTETKQR